MKVFMTKKIRKKLGNVYVLKMASAASKHQIGEFGLMESEKTRTQVVWWISAPNTIEMYLADEKLPKEIASSIVNSARLIRYHMPN